MGLFLENYDNYKKRMAENGNNVNFFSVKNSYDVDPTGAYIQYGMGLLCNLGQMLATGNTDGKGGKEDNDDPLSSKEEFSKVKKFNLEKKLNSILSNLGAKSVGDLDNIYEEKNMESDKRIKNFYDENLAIFENNTDYYSNQIKDLENMKSNATEEEQIKKIEINIELLKSGRKEAKRIANEKYEELVAKETENLQTIKLQMEQAKAISERIDTLKNPSNYINTTSEKIKEKTKDYSAFNKAREKFLNEPNQSNLDELKKAYKEFDGITKNDTVNRAMNLLKFKYSTVNQNGKNVTLNWS